VPFGRHAVEEPNTDEQSEDVQQTSLAPPPGPEAFWGEDSAEIHAVLQGPDACPCDDEDRDPDPRPTPNARHKPRRALALIGAGLLAAFAAVMGAVIGLGGRASPPAHVATLNPAPGDPAAEHLRLASLQKSLAATTATRPAAPRKTKARLRVKRSHPRPVHSSAPKPARQASPIHTSASTYPVSTQSAPTTTSSVGSAPSTSVSSPAPTQPVNVRSSSSTGSSVSAPTPPTSSSTTSGGGATSSHSGGQSSKTKAPAGPTGNSALLGPGHCNC
jgi:hypothetical protein